MNKITIIEAGGVDLLWLFLIGATWMKGPLYCRTRAGEAEVIGGAMPKVKDEHVNAGLSRQEYLSLSPGVFLKTINITGWMTRE